MIELKNISKTYRMGKMEVQALQDVSLKISSGEFVAIMGPSGSGKSTLMHILGFLDRPDQGEYTFEGRRLTGLSDEEKAKVKEVSANIPIVLSANMSTGVNLLFKLIAEASKILGKDYEINVVEAHHAEKKDAPSGTAKELARIVKNIKKDIDIPIDSVREGEIVGEHTITFESDADILEITHSAKTRDIFAKGALTAAKFIVGKKNGLFAMKDVLAL